LRLGRHSSGVPGAVEPACDRFSAVGLDLCHEPAGLAADRQASQPAGGRRFDRTAQSLRGDARRMTAVVHSVANIFRPLSTPAQSIYGLSMLVVAVCLAIFLVVAGVLAYTIVRFRRPTVDVDREPPQVYGSNQIEIAWTVIPIVIVLVLSMATARVISDVQNKRPPNNALRVTVVGHQWWWEIRYPALGVLTANELHVPVSAGTVRQPTFLRLESADVAHSFWVPQLAGKTDLIPNHPNSMWIEPNVEGTFLGNCAEFCGLQHANMLLRVVVEPSADFDKWVASQRQ